MLENPIKDQLRIYFQNLQQTVTLSASLGEGEKSNELKNLLEEIASLSEMIVLTHPNDNARQPSFAISGSDGKESVRFAGIPLGHEFNSLILAILQAGGHPSKLSPETIALIQDLPGEYHFETYFSLSCQNCPDVVQALNLMSVINPRIHHTAIDGALFQAEVEERQVLAVPSVFLNGTSFAQGRMTIEEILSKIDVNAEQRDIDKLNAKPLFDILVIGAGPAGAAAAIYAGRKGIKTGIVAERIGGQVLDTMSIENLISIPHTEGPKLGRNLEEHIRQYAIDLINLQRVEKLIPAEKEGDPVGILLANGAKLQARAVILAPGAQWRLMNVPGENFYRNRGVAFCPHCDGPLFKGKNIAVIGGGNSGVEAAIDLANIANNVTLLEFDDKLRADQVLQDKLASLSNVSVLKSVQTTEVLGDGAKVTGLSYKERGDGSEHHIVLDGVFVQIGLIPGTDWLKETIDLNERGEIIVDPLGQTSSPGIFAAGDATISPYKQIVIAMGDGAKTALAAFDYLIREGAK